MTLRISLAAVPSQTLSVTLGAQSCQVAVYQKSTGVFLDLSVSNVPIITAALCLDRTSLVREPYLGFAGRLAFVDTQGTEDPTYAGFGARFQLVYLP